MSPVRPTVTVVGHRLADDDHRLRDFLTRSAQPFEWLEAGTTEADAILQAVGRAGSELPVLIDGDDVIANATVQRLAEAWGVIRPPKHEEYELVIVGAGPAGLAAAVYAASDGLQTLVVEEDLPGGQASHTSMIENFFGFPEGIGGAELARLAGRQAERFDAELLLLTGVTGSAHPADAPFTVDLAGGHTVRALTAVAAPGMVWRRLEAPGVEDLVGQGIYYGAGRSEAAQCSGDDVVVVGAGNSAGQAAMHLANSAARVKILVRGNSLKKSMSDYLVRRVEAHPLIEVRLSTTVQRAHATDGWFSGVTTRGPDAEAEELPARVMFLCLGGTPRTGWAADTGVLVDGAGFVLTGPDLLTAGVRPESWSLPRDPLALETSVPGLFAAGDVRHGSTKRVAAAVGDGAMATALVHMRLEELQREGSS